MSNHRPRIRHKLDLERAWRTIAPPDGPRRHAVWIMLIGDDQRALTQVVQVDDAFEVPPPGRRDVLAGFVGELAADAPRVVTGVAFLRTRPGHFAPTADDRAWAECLGAVAEDAGLTSRTVFVATDLVLEPVPREEVPVLASA